MTIYFDKDCAFCQRMVFKVVRCLGLPEAWVRPAQEDAEILKQMEAQNSWVVVLKGRSYFCFEAFTKLVEASKWKSLAPVLRFPLVRWMGYLIYRLVANNRTFFSKFF